MFSQIAYRYRPYIPCVLPAEQINQYTLYLCGLHICNIIGRNTIINIATLLTNRMHDTHYNLLLGFNKWIVTTCVVTTCSRVRIANYPFCSHALQHGVFLICSVRKKDRNSLSNVWWFVDLNTVCFIWNMVTMLLHIFLWCVLGTWRGWIRSKNWLSLILIALKETLEALWIAHHIFLNVVFSDR